MPAIGFLEIDGIPGESIIEGFKDQIEVLGWEHNISMPVSRNTSGRGGLTTGAANLGEFKIKKKMDKASPILMRYSFIGQHIPRIKLTLCRQAGNQFVNFCEIELEGAVISTFQTTADITGDGLAEELVGFTFSKMKKTYTAIDPTGKRNGSTQAQINQRESLLGLPEATG
jgi:type VI secretion system secreted protein Hcp